MNQQIEPANQQAEPLNQQQHGNRLRDALAALWDSMADDYGLLPDLAADAVLARADRGELVAATPRLLELLVGGTLPIDQACQIAVRLGTHDWTSRQRACVEETLDSWWQETLMREPGEHDFPYTPDVVLGVLAGYDAPMIRWFEPWLAELDGPGASHLAAIVLGRPVHERDGDRPSDEAAIPSGSSGREIPAWAQTPPSPVTPDGPAWHGKQDQATQVIAWAKTETVVSGLALIGATHLEPDVMSDLLDRLI